LPSSPPATDSTAAATIDRPASNRPLRWGWIFGAAFLSLGLLTNGLEGALHFDGAPLDGPFQLFNALRRIAAGQHIGDTFQFFHGPALPYVFYPTFALGGATFFAAEASRQLLSVILFLGLYAAVFRAWTGSWKTGVPLAVAATLVSIEFRLNALILPINSLLGVRTTLPIVAAIHLLLRPPSRRADVERGLILGLALLIGTEQGVAALGALAIVLLVTAVGRRAWAGPAISFATTAAAAVLVYLGITLALAGPAHLGSVLHFNFVEVPQDQLWYFGAPPNPFLSRWSDILPLLSVTRWWTVLAAAVGIAFVGLWRARRDADPRRPMAEGFLMIYGLISLASMLGSFVAVYAEPAVRAAVIVLLVWIYRRWPEWKAALAIRLPGLARHGPSIAIGLLVFATVLRQPVATVAMVRTPLHVAVAHVFDSQGKTMSVDWRRTEATGMAVVEGLRRTTGHTPTIWSTYAGLLEWKADVFHPYTDYIIHALGPERRAAYAARFIASRPELVQTIRPSYGTTSYELWLESAHWNFYRPLLQSYDVVAGGPWSIFWTPRAGPPPAAPMVIADGAIPPGQLAISVDPGLPRDSVGLFEVRLAYRVDNPIAKLPVIGGMPRYLVDVGGTPSPQTISLAPYARSRAFPVVASGRSPILLRGHVESLFGVGTMTLDSIRVERIPLSAANMAWLGDVLRRTERAAAGDLAR
jgi:hypothetical protein